MAARSFQLQPFEAIASNTALSITGRVTLEKDRLAIAYLLSGDLEKVAIAPLRSGSQRRDRLWEQTCFEFFLACGPTPTTNTPYWEGNLSPSGDWNVFALERYRQNSQEEEAISDLPFGVENKPDSLYLDLWELDISGLVGTHRPLWLGISAVIVLKTGSQTFWAIAHPSSEPDFHHPNSFVLAL
ncbi:DOMON-like domain-containing protein [cf. Phormidesmis sp. LEGE 11477]|uniref:DOMON-like domain-containing protein n=1 Tax=cf. Phormidesmis sp. LEGE 11477 TaxID=1828680 RepID=UPI001881E6A4|nr:DOMON-like domain-containing protein [cf. Phormidesmis sp. LEGE 11477]MBE9059625.1 DOMON-like domain-containing protein [cf. Phormidesmis sp. LEGE 11477]